MLSFTHSFFSLSCTLQGAGGIGGLLAVVRDDGGFAPTYDANGNVSEYIQLSAVQTDNYPFLPIARGIVAHYEYDAFGNTVVQSGNLADTFTHRFSTKPWCPVTSLIEYLFRPYSPSRGRVTSRDPIEEQGGINLYAFCANDPVNKWDYLGMKYKLFLTFDDGPLNGIKSETVKVLDALKDTDIKATFFLSILNGVERGKGIPDTKTASLVRMYKEKHLLGNHGAVHDYRYGQADAMARNFEDNAGLIEAILKKTEGNKSLQIPSLRKYGRLQGGNAWYLGEGSALSGPGGIKGYEPKQTEASAKAVTGKGYLLFGWDQEWRPGTSPETLAEETINKLKKGKVKTKDRLVLLAHDADFNELNLKK